MLVVSRTTGALQDDQFANLGQYLTPGDCLVVNDTRVVPARLHGRRNGPSGAEVEVFLLEPLDEAEREWKALVKPGKRVRVGDTVLFGSDFACRVLSHGEYGERVLRFETERGVREAAEEYGSIPLPPYIHRSPEASDLERYQTVYAEKRGSIAAPTAGLHFTPEILDSCRAAGATIARVTLHVGLGTFAPLREQDLDRVQLHEETFEIRADDAALVSQARRVVCVGTTSVRALESACAQGGLREVRGKTRLFIRPGFAFQATGALLTNFHLPESSLLMLVCAFAGTDLAMAAYRHAVAARYRFFSYGDCMLIV